MHSRGVIHRDIKPRNLLVNSNCELKICDFGLSRVQNDQIAASNNSEMTDYIATRWYRAPELLFLDRQYTAAIDMWSVGVIMAELMRREPLFAAPSSQEMISMINELVGSPKEEQINKIKDQDTR